MTSRRHCRFGIAVLPRLLLVLVALLAAVPPAAYADLMVVGNVGLDEFGACTELFRDPVAGVVHVDNDDLAAVVDDHFRGRGTQAGAAAGDEEVVLGYLHGSGFPESEAR